MNDFAVFILTHGRPDKVITYRSLRNQGYTGPIYIVIDDEDEAREEYRKRFPLELIVFDKRMAAQTFDVGDNLNERRGVVYARNANFEIAKRLGVRYFLQLDDDYQVFSYKFSDEFGYVNKKILIYQISESLNNSISLDKRWCLAYPHTHL